MFLKELSEREKKEYNYRERTIIWKDTDTGEYKFYVCVILETSGWNRFDYDSFHYGSLPTRNDTDVVVQDIVMKENKIPLRENVYLLDHHNWKPHYTRFIEKLSDAF